MFTPIVNSGVREARDLESEGMQTGLWDPTRTTRGKNIWHVLEDETTHRRNQNTNKLHNIRRITVGAGDAITHNYQFFCRLITKTPGIISCHPGDLYETQICSERVVYIVLLTLTGA